MGEVEFDYGIVERLESHLAGDTRVEPQTARHTADSQPREDRVRASAEQP